MGSYVILFALCSMCGWVFESAFAVVKTRKWEARGFLYGPVCPIYGVGVVAIVLASKALLRYAGVDYAWWQIALAGFFGSMVLEYAVSWALEKLFHAYWWDYSDMPLNICGRTCVPAACLFALGGLAAVYVISPGWDALMAHVPHAVVEPVSYAIVALFAVDAALSACSLTRIQEQVASASEAFHARAEGLTDGLVDRTEEAARRLAAERARIKDEVLQGAVGGMSASVRSTLGRIEGFRLPERPSAPGLSSFADAMIAKVRSHRRGR